MTVKELIVKLVLKRGAMKAEVDAARAELGGVRDAGRDMGAGVGQGAAEAAHGLKAVSEAGRELGASVADGAAEAGRELRGLKEAGDKAGKALAEGARTAEGGYARLLGVLGKAAALAGGMAFVKSQISQYMAAADAVGKLADAYGENVEELQAWGEAAARAGGSSEAFYASLDALNEKIQDYVRFDSGEAKPILEKLGINPRDDQGRVKSTTRLMGELAGAFEGLSRQEAAGLGKKLGLDQGTIMLLQSGQASVAALVKRQKELGVYTSKDAAIAAAANDAFADLHQAWQALSAMIARWIVPALQWVADKLTALAVWVRRHEGFITAFFVALAALITARMIPALARMAVANAAAFAPILLIGAAIAAVSALIALLVDDFLTWSEGGESMFGDFWAFAVEAFERIKAAVAAFIDFVRPIWDGLKQIWTGVWHAIKAAFRGDMEGVKAAFAEIWEGIKNYLLGWVDVIKNIILGLWEWIKGIVGRMGEAISDAASGMAESAKGAVSGAWSKVKGGVKDMFGFGDDASAAQTPAAGGGGSVNSVKSETRIGAITVHTQATDADGIARDLGGAIRDDVMQHDYAMGY